MVYTTVRVVAISVIREAVTPTGSMTLNCVNRKMISEREEQLDQRTLCKKKKKHMQSTE